MEEDNSPSVLPTKVKSKRVKNRKAKPTMNPFDTASRITGFLSDLTEIPSNLINILLFVSSLTATGIVLFTGGRNIGQLPTSGLITPPIAFFMWLTSLYAAIAWLHKYWEGNRSQKQFAPRFWMFLVDDLIFKFRVASRLFPLFVLALVLVWIIGYTDYYY